MAPQRHAQVRYLSSPRMGNYPLPRPGEPHTFARQKRARDAPGQSRGGQKEAERRVGPAWFFGFFAPPAHDRPFCTAGVALPGLGRGRWGGSLKVDPKGRVRRAGKGAGEVGTRTARRPEGTCRSWGDENWCLV